MARRVFRSPGGNDQDKAPWEGRTHPKVRAARRDVGLAGKTPVASRPADAVLAKLQRARGPRGAEPAPPPPKPELSLAQSGEQAPVAPAPEVYWGSAASQENIPAVSPPQEFLSGGDELFDPATGWDYGAITGSQVIAVEPPPPEPAPPAAAAAPAATAAPAAGPTPLDESSDFAVEIEDEPSAPVTVDDALSRAQELFASERDAEGLQLLAAASQVAPNDARLTTWIEFGERRVMRRACPTASLDRVPRLAHPLGPLAQAARPDQLAILQLVDGRNNAAAIRTRLGVEAVPYWTTLGRLVERGWVGWTDDA